MRRTHASSQPFLLVGVSYVFFSHASTFHSFCRGTEGYKLHSRYFKTASRITHGMLRLQSRCWKLENTQELQKEVNVCYRFHIIREWIVLPIRNNYYIFFWILLYRLAFEPSIRSCHNSSQYSDVLIKLLTLKELAFTSSLSSNGEILLSLYQICKCKYFKMLLDLTHCQAEIFLVLIHLKC